MDEKGAVNSYLVAISEDKGESLYPMFFGVSCAFFALRLVSEPEMNDERLLEVRNGLLQGSAHLLGLLVWSVRRVQADSGKGETLHKLQKAEKEIEEFKRMRKEDAKANERVVGIFAAQEQSWFSHRKKLRQQIGALMNELRVMQTKSDEVISELNDKLQEKDQLLQSKDKLLELEEHKRKGLEEKLLESKNVVEELRETSKREAKEHSSELWKHKTAFIELVSNQRQLEAEMGRALRQVESTKRELDSVLMQKEESVLMAQKLSAELIKTRKDLEQKDKILSAMLRKSKLDTAEKQMLLKEVKLSKAKRKQAELETERWRVVSESRRERNSLKNMLSKHSSSNATVPSHSRNRSQTEFLIEYEQSGHQKEPEVFFLHFMTRTHMKEVRIWCLQLMLKDEKLEAFQWSFLSMELESKRLQSHVEGLNHDLSQLRQENMRLGALSQEVEPQVEEETTSTSQSRDIVLPVQSPKKEFEKQKDVALDPGSIQLLRASPEEVDIVEKSAVYGQCLSKSSASAWKMDLHALGVSYKIKRLKQQLLLMLERLTGKRESVEDGEDGDNASVGIKGLHILISMLNKQVSRYQALQRKTDELCTRMHDIDLDVSCGGSSLSRTKEETKTLEHFLEETLHLQRYMVATGQKLMEIQSKIALGFAEAGEELDGSASFDMKQFADSVRTLFRDVQRGLEVRIARIIGDLEGTLARDGMIHLRN
ncbi:ribonuclease P protein subunit P38-like protein [Actinidia rufa]|uniref:Ribonuclease P protein subunit P38-like protein n=1 Tax=Actinidia rufa TaxID=165716 RepID=A0A7J0DBK5_9ERIC|nr:ribonuclease P protein subunit P38-like protein [Actinidia rufa]